MNRRVTPVMNLVAGSVVLALAGCPTTDEIALGQTTAAPATKTAYLNNDEDGTGYYLNISPGVAIGVRCWDSCSYACDGAVVTSNDDAILSILDADPALSSPHYVLVAHTIGATQLEVRNACATQIYSVTVE
ncbi:MAG: hypothetical protein IPL79_12010 [Myxococcales bacterium]|nr:hypothetical protein [Myxococcales bacterium]